MSKANRPIVLTTFPHPMDGVTPRFKTVVTITDQETGKVEASIEVESDDIHVENLADRTVLKCGCQPKSRAVKPG